MWLLQEAEEVPKLYVLNETSCESPFGRTELENRCSRGLAATSPWALRASSARRIRCRTFPCRDLPELPPAVRQAPAGSRASTRECRHSSGHDPRKCPCRGWSSS